MKVVLAHEWLTNVAGSEKVLLKMAEAFPEAEIVFGVADPELVATHLPGRTVRSLLSPKLPRILTKWQHYAPLLWLAWRFVKIEADVVVVSSHFATHQVCHRATGKSIVYYHTPMRIAWKFEMEQARVRKRTAQFLRTFLPIIQYVDRLPAPKATLRLSNSSETQRRVREFYGCESQIVHPPIDFAAPSVDDSVNSSDPYYLCFGRLVDYKRVDHAIAACNALGRRLVVAGTGPAEEYLRSIAGPTVEFVGAVSDREKASLLANARALLFPGLEDFGIVPVEAMTYGTPVIALGQGGVLDSVIPEAGLLYGSCDPIALTRAISSFELMHFDSELIKQHAANFGEATFRVCLEEAVMSV